MSQHAIPSSVENKLNMYKLKKRLGTLDSELMGRVIEYVTRLETDLETERMRVVACGVAALSNTRDSAAQQALSPDNPYRSACYDDVVKAVQREMKYREALHSIAHIENKDVGLDWEEIEEARKIAEKALEQP